MVVPEEEEEDPFGAFGSDDDEEGDEGDGVRKRQQQVEDDDEGTRVARALLVQSAHNNKTGGGATSAENAGSSSAEVANDRGDELLARRPSQYVPLELRCWREPLYRHPQVRLVSLEPSSGIGGGRGYAALEADLAPGTLALVEEPACPGWSEEQIGRELGLVSVRRVLEWDTGVGGGSGDNTKNNGDAIRLLHEIEHLHPTKAVVDVCIEVSGNCDEQDGDDRNNSQFHQVQEMMRVLRRRYCCDNGDRESDEISVDALVDTASRRGLRNSDGSPVTDMDCMRILLALRYNGLESGVYLHVAMLNHSDRPNCVKFLPQSSEPTYSEVRTTRWIRAGELLTISYLPTVLCHASRRRYLWEQHRFDIRDDFESPVARQMELVAGRLPPSALNRCDPETSVTYRIEKAIAELRGLYLQEAGELQYPSNSDDSVDQIKALEQASRELCEQANEQLQNPNHVLLIPALELHLDTADLVQRRCRLGLSHRTLLLGRVVGTAKRLAELQGMFHGPDHFDLARTKLDLAQAIEELLSTSANHLLQLCQDEYSSVAAWSSLENKSRKDFQRIKSLYPRDAGEWISKGG